MQDDPSVSAQAGATAAEWSATSILFQLGGGVIAGVAVGYAARTAVKVALMCLGAILILMYMLMHAGFITVNWDIVGQGIENGSKAVGSWLWQMITSLSCSLVGFAGGFFLGWKRKFLP